MKITIQGQDYSAALDAARPLTIERTLNHPSLCRMDLSLAASGALATPAWMQRLVVTGDDGTVYFTGYIACTPMPQYVGLAIDGPRSRYAIEAVSDEFLLDQALLPPSKGVTGETAGALMTALVTHTGLTALSTQALTLNDTIHHLVPEPGSRWSKSARQVASEARAAYRALNGALTLTPVPGAVHTLNEADGSLSPANLTLTENAARGLANDVTVCGAQEPVAYATEYFAGDGVTTQFYLSAAPYFLPSAQSSLVRELFNEPQIDQRLWSVSGGGGNFALGGGGLAMQGGNGIDGQTMLSWLDSVEMGGTLLLEAEGVALAAGSTGIVAGFFSGSQTAAGCVAGFQATAQQGTGIVTLQPVVQGTPAGTAYTLNAANQYSLRVRVHCPEPHRVLATYRASDDSGAVIAGGDWIPAPGKIQMDLQEFVNGVGGMPVTLYDGGVASLPGICTMAAASSINLQGSMRALNLRNLGSGWVVSTLRGGGTATRRMGAMTEAAECQLERAGKLVFYAGFAPAVGEQIAVSYRTAGRAVGRAVNAASQQALAQAGSPAVAAWIGSVAHPAARNSADCRNAAQVLAQCAACGSALWSGVYKGTSAEFASDVWPGDALALCAPSAQLNAQVVVRAVKVSYTASDPDLVAYDIAFANDWANDLAITTSATVPADTWLPASVAPAVLANLTGLTVTAISGSAITVNTGATPPPGGGFEVRRRDFAFMPGADSGLVIRGTESNLTFARETASDRFYIRMFDAATPPNYSEWSAALFVNLLLG